MPHNEGLTVYESWDLTPPFFSRPSCLYSLEPVGIGTAYGESLTSYIARLAQAHHVTAAALFQAEIMKLVERKYLSNKMRDSGFPSVLGGPFRDVARATNGMGKTAADLTRAVEALTLRNDISFLTMKPWAAIVAQRRLLRLTHAACFYCYEEWRVQGKVIYDPLLWALEPVKVCPKHGRPLSLHCRFCHRALWPLASHSYPGHCSNCGEWLGTFVPDTRHQSQPLAKAEWSQAVWIAIAVGDLIAAAPGLAVRPARQAVAQAISTQANRFAGKLARLARFLQMKRGTVQDWRRGEKVPELGMLLKMRFRLDMRPLKLLTSHSLQRKGATVAAQTQNSKINRLNRPRPLDIEECRRVLEMALQEYPPPTFKEVARRLNRRPSPLLYRFPDQYRLLVARHAQHQKAMAQERWDSIKPALELALTEEPPPLPDALAKRIGCSPSSLQRYHRFLYRALSVRHSHYRRNLILNLRPRLEAALNSEDPPTSFATLAGRYGYNKATLRKYFPDLVPLLIQRFLNHRKENYLARRQRLETEIRQVVLHLHRCGLYPSLRRIESRMTPPGNIVGNRLATELVRAIRDEL